MNIFPPEPISPSRMYEGRTLQTFDGKTAEQFLWSYQIQQSCEMKANTVPTVVSKIEKVYSFVWYLPVVKLC